MTETAAGPEQHSGPKGMSVRFAATDGIRVLNFEDESIVFNPISWDAHLLNAAAAAVLELLTEAPRSVGDVATLFRDTLCDAEHSEAFEHARGLLREFEQLGLVRHLKEDSFAGG